MKPLLKNDTIFVSIASYRDDVCNSTLKSLYEMSKNPKNIYVGICQQNKSDEDKDCLITFENNPNISILRIPHTEAKGPTYARYLCSTLWKGEEYYLQIDSHSKFVKDWDEKCINMIKDIKQQGLSQKPVLSHYPKEISEYKDYNADSNKKYDVTRLCRSFFNNRDMLSFFGAEIMNSNKEYYKTPYVAGGMVFSESKFLEELPYDPELPYLFVGEEILHSIRYYTNGWDIFTPNENIIFHEYTRSGKPKIWTDNPSYSDVPAFEKVKFYIGLVKTDSKIPNKLKKNLHKYGLGKERSLQDYYDFAGIDLKSRTVKKNFCRKDNAASDEDIFRSNEKNHKKKFKDETTIENFEILSRKNTYVLYLVIFVLFLACLSLYFYVKNIKSIKRYFRK
jgi:hypothetical protein